MPPLDGRFQCYVFSGWAFPMLCFQWMGVSNVMFSVGVSGARIVLRAFLVKIFLLQPNLAQLLRARTLLMEIFLLLSQLAQLHCRNLTCHGLVMRSLRQWWTMPLNFRETFAGPKKKASCVVQRSTHYLEDASLFGFRDWPSRSCNPMLTKRIVRTIQYTLHLCSSQDAAEGVMSVLVSQFARAKKWDRFLCCFEASEVWPPGVCVCVAHRFFQFVLEGVFGDPAMLAVISGRESVTTNLGKFCLFQSIRCSQRMAPYRVNCFWS